MALAFDALRRPLLLRGGAMLAPLLAANPAMAADAAALVNCVGPAGGFFGNVRVPAALLAGATLGQAFAKPDESRGKWLPTAFSLLMITSLIMEVMVVFASTATATRLLGGGFDPMATNAIAFLTREFEMPFVFCRFTFFAGLLAFLAGLCLRVWAAVPGPFGSAVAVVIAGNSLMMLEYFNSTVISYRFGIVGLGVRLGQLMFLNAGPLGLLGMVTSLMGTAFAVVEVLKQMAAGRKVD